MGRAARPQQEALRSASVCQGFTTDLAAFASVSHPSALKRLRVCQRVATVPDVCPSLRLARDSPDVCPSLFALPAACAFTALRGVRRGRCAVCLAVYRALPSRWRAGAAGESSQGDTGEVQGGAGGWARVKSGCIFPIL